MRLIIAVCISLIAGSSAFALKWSDKSKVDDALNAIAMADTFAAGTPQSISCRVNLVAQPRGQKPPEVNLSSGTAYTNLLSAIATKLNADKTTAETYLASVGVTNN